MHYDRTIIAYHGCDAKVADTLLGGGSFIPSSNDYDWLGKGIYFWEYGADRALQFARDQLTRGKVETPTIVGALIQLGNCFDLMDTRFTDNLAAAFEPWAKGLRAQGVSLPQNGGPAPDHKLRRLDCAVLNWYLNETKSLGQVYDTVRCGFVEGDPVFEGSGIYRQSHIQLAVRSPACILGVFRPSFGHGQA